MSVSEWTALILGLLATLGPIVYVLVRVKVKVDDLLMWQKDEVSPHIRSTTLHLDPVRDEQRWNKLEQRLDQMNKKLDNLIMFETTTKRKQGDTDE